ncbi:hypothetical protein HPB52_003000 [Rhipicephalus sanguineus]|uniref:Glucosylceramidase n=1 Tax=Rhipicephalus sanguineus TaxID=34632 RepID=A0A9D4PYH6_RHISA|nr:hypothetical protein HPB52_003000 [Rhipicephalus sanguineus]
MNIQEGAEENCGFYVAARGGTHTYTLSTPMREEYGNHGVRLYGLTAQNEPTPGFTPAVNWQTLGFTAQSQKDFIKLDMGPTLAVAGYGSIQLLIFDDSNSSLSEWSNALPSFGLKRG